MPGCTRDHTASCFPQDCGSLFWTGAEGRLVDFALEPPSYGRVCPAGAHGSCDFANLARLAHQKVSALLRSLSYSPPTRRSAPCCAASRTALPPEGQRLVARPLVQPAAQPAA
jgi:hypothetical protein